MRRALAKERRQIKRAAVLRERFLKTGTVRSPNPPLPARFYSKGAERDREILRYFVNHAVADPRRRGSVYEADDGRQVFAVPPTFSFLEDADTAIAALREMAYALIQTSSPVLHIDQSASVLIDYCAEAVASALAIAGKNGTGVGFQGTFPRSSELTDIVVATGMPLLLGFNPPRMPDGFKAFRLRHGRRKLEVGPALILREQAVTQFTEYIDACLGEYGWMLDEAGAWYLSELAGEVVGNAEDHSGTDDWWIGGYLRRRADDQYGDCHIAIFNFGRTIYQTLQQLPPDAQLRREIEAHVRHHVSTLTLFGPSFDEEQLWTLYALQQGVSWKNGDPDAIGDQGQGTVALINFFQKLSSEGPHGAGPKMCVVSGGTQIVFDRKYEMKMEERNGVPSMVIAFNGENNLQAKPDPNNVRKLHGFFPGTVISMRFYFNQEHLDRVGSESPEEPV